MLNIRRINWGKRSGRKVYDLCLSIPVDDLANCVSLSDVDGKFLVHDDASPILIQQNNYV